MKSVFSVQCLAAAVLVLSVSVRSNAQQCDSITWLFAVNEFAIDGDALVEDLNDKGWNEEFFSTNDAEVSIGGMTDCPGSFPYNTRLASNRARYLLNYFETRTYPHLTIADCYAIPERNCSKNHQGYHDEDRATVLTVCWKPATAEVAVDTAFSPAPVIEETVKKEETEEVRSLEKITDLVAGQTLVLEGLNFYPGSHRTLPEAKPVLKKLLDIMKENPNLMIEIQGHVCCGKRPEEDGLDEETGETKLSWNRAKYVYDYLVKNGIEPMRITYKGYAMQRPLVTPEVTIQDQMKNRRVEIMVISR